MSIESEIRWVIVGKIGLYIGRHCMTRKEAIAQHVSELLSGVGDFPEMPPFVSSRLNDDQRRAWEYCQRRGDVVTKATISWEQPEGTES